MVDGEPRPGAHWDGRATTITVRSPAAERVELALRTLATAPEWRTDLDPLEGAEGWWTIRTERVRPGDLYGFRVHGPLGNPRFLLLDPAAGAVSGEIDWAAVDFAGSTDTGPHVPWSVVVDPTFDWGDDRPPRTPMADSVIYEANVRSLTALHPDVPEHLRGTYLGLAEPAVVGHLVDLGVTAVELLPVHHFVTGRAQWEKGLRNLWGYDPVAWYAPHAGYATSDNGRQVAEMQAMVRALHEAGIEVLLDVVFNHTGEYDRTGPTICHRGLDDLGWYRHHPDGSYDDTTGCHNAVDLQPAPNRALVIDCLRHWVEVFHVDGFRFDLATTLLRDADGVRRDAPFLADVAAEPALADVKLIAEPWDAVGGGYDLGGFPHGWSEWNDRFRDDVRDAWRGASTTREALATRLAGSSDLFGATRRPSASINFVTAHDGFTLTDLVSYTEPRNLANGEEGHDGTRDNRSWNCGVEGPSADPLVVELRERQRRNLLATLLMARGVPMLTAGDELGRTQQGNNNPYCQDNPVSWVDWEHVDTDLLRFTTRAIALRRALPELRTDEWLQATDDPWWGSDGEPMTQDAWWSTDDPVLVLAVPGAAVVVNLGPSRCGVALPTGVGWAPVLDTSTPDGAPTRPLPLPAGATLPVEGRSVVVLTARH